MVNTHRRTAIFVGVLYIIGTVMGVMSVALTGPILHDPGSLIQVASNENQLIAGALCVLVMGLALAMVPVLMLPILKKQNEVLALGYVVFRGALEATIDVMISLSWIALIAFAHQYAIAGASAASGFQTLGASIAAAGDSVSPVAAIVFSLGALMFYYLLYQTRLIPRWVSGWGLIAIVLHLAAGGLLAMFGVITEFSTISVVLALPIALQEMVMAVWMIAKGFDALAIASLSAKPA
jgi:hypothetical protein